MSQALQFISLFLAAAGFCIAFASSLVLLTSKRNLASQPQLQRFLGLMLMLSAIQSVAMSFNFLVDFATSGILQLLLILAQVGVIVYVVVKLFHSFARHPEAAEASVPKRKRAVPEEVEEGLENPNMEDFLFFQKIEALMVKEMLFCEQELSREDLASAIGTNRTYLVRSIKTATGKTFSEYITSLRTSYAAKLLTTSDEPLDLIGTLAGFRSKSAYYRAFSSAYDCSPSDYRKNSVTRQGTTEE